MKDIFIESWISITVFAFIVNFAMIYGFLLIQKLNSVETRIKKYESEKDKKK